MKQTPAVKRELFDGHMICTKLQAVVGHELEVPYYYMVGKKMGNPLMLRDGKGDDYGFYARASRLYDRKNPC